MILYGTQWVSMARRISIYALLARTLVVLTACVGGGGGSNGGSSGESENSGSYTGGETNPVCLQGVSGWAVQRPVFVRNVSGQTGWFASPMTADLDGNGSREIVAAYYTLYVYDAQGNQLDSVAGNGGRIYAPHVVCDLDGDGVVEIVCGQRHEVYVYEWRNGLQLKSGCLEWCTFY